MRTDPEMLNLILHTAKTLQVEAVAMSGSQTNPKAPKDEFQDYDVVYVVDDLDTLTSNLAWLDQFGMRLIEQHNVLGHRRLYLMFFEDRNRIDLTLCPKEYIQEWVDSEANFEVIKDDRNQLIYATDHLYGICQQELLKVLAWQVTSDRGIVDIGKNYKYLFQYLPAGQEKEFSALLDLSSFDKIIQSLFATMGLFNREAQILAQKMGFTYDMEVAEKMISYAKEKFSNH